MGRLDQVAVEGLAVVMAQLQLDLGTAKPVLAGLMVAAVEVAHFVSVLVVILAPQADLALSA
jgi:hypothetical protein